MVCLASAQYNPVDHNSTVIYGFSTEDLTLKRSITINGMQHVTAITEEPATGTLWVVGFNIESIPDYPDPSQPPFYYACLANIPRGIESVQAVSISHPGSHDLALPMSIVWTVIPAENPTEGLLWH